MNPTQVQILKNWLDWMEGEDMKEEECLCSEYERAMNMYDPNCPTHS